MCYPIKGELFGSYRIDSYKMNVLQNVFINYEIRGLVTSL